MQVNELLENSAEKHPDKPALFHDGKWVNYGELEAESNRLGNFLLESGIQRGDRVAILCRNCLQYVAAYFAILKAGGVAVPLNSEASPREIAYIIDSCEAKALVTNKALDAALLLVLPDRKTLRLIVAQQVDAVGAGRVGDVRVSSWTEALSSGQDGRPSVHCIDLDLESIVFTSGSTGVPKGVMLSHLNTVSNMTSICQYLRLTGSDRIMAVLPFSYIYGKSLLLTHLLVGGSVVIDNRFTYPNVVLQSMLETEVTGFAGVPSTFTILLNRSSLGKMRFPALRYVTQAGGAMAPAVQQKVAEAFAPAQLYVMYGATEAAPRLSYLDPAVLTRKWGSIGKAVPNVDLLIVDEQGRELPQGETGEIAARGSNIMQGYWKDPEATASVLRNGLYFTGDLGRMDEEGYFYVVGRKKDIIKVKGFRVSAKEIEEVLLEIEGIHEAAVIGVDDEVLGEAIKAFVVLKQDRELTRQAMNQHLAGRLAAFKMPKYIEICSTLPKNESGKVLKTELRTLR